MKLTRYFHAMRTRPDRAAIEMERIERAIQHPVKEVIQQDGRIRRWAPIAETDGRRYCVWCRCPTAILYGRSAFFEQALSP